MSKLAVNQELSAEAEVPEVPLERPVKAYKKQPDNAGTRFGEIIYWFTIIGCLMVIAGLVNMFFESTQSASSMAMFQALFDGQDIDSIWQASGRETPNGHWYLDQPGEGSSLAQLGMVVAILSTLPALLVAMITFIKRKSYFFGSLSLLAASIIFTAVVI